MQLINNFRLLVGILVLGFFTSCEDPISVELDEGKSQLAVDALIKVNDGIQQVRLTLTNKYFDNSKPAQGVSGAVLVLTSNLGKSYPFIENPATPGNYLSADTIKGQTGEVFSLSIEYQGQEYFALSPLVRGTVIDTLFIEDRIAEFGNTAGKFAQLIARDSVGVGDFCWIKYRLNGKPDLRYNRLGAAFPADAAFAPGSADGLEFIFPIRNSINGDEGYLIGDVIDVDLLSIDAEQWRFLKEMEIQLNNSGLFADPIANVRGNLFNKNPNSKVQAVGCFGMARVSRAQVTVQ